MKVLVTRVREFIESHLCEKFLNKGYKINTLIRYNSSQSKKWLENISDKKLSIIYHEITNYNFVINAIDNCEYVSNLKVKENLKKYTNIKNFKI
tara:strand:+ start:119 stop:400 length:282 start_codon:yes stop_codon:yes gene_type:complete